MESTLEGQRYEAYLQPHTSYSISTRWNKRGPTATFRTNTTFREQFRSVRCCSRCYRVYEFEVDTAIEFILARDQQSRQRLGILVALVSAIVLWSAAITIAREHHLGDLQGWDAVLALGLAYVAVPLALTLAAAYLIPAPLPGFLARLVTQLVVGLLLLAAWMGLDARRISQ